MTCQCQCTPVAFNRTALNAQYETLRRQRVDLGRTITHYKTLLEFAQKEYDDCTRLSGKICDELTALKVRR